MKKISTILTMAAIAMSAFTTRAESVSVTTKVDVNNDLTYVEFKTTTAEVTFNDLTDGVCTWTIDNFLGSGKPLTFSYKKNSGMGGYTAMTIAETKEKAEGEEDTPNYLWSNDEGYTLKLTNADGETIEYTDVYYVDGSSYTGVHTNNDSNTVTEGYRNDAYFTLVGKNNDTEYYMDITFNFNPVRKVNSWEAKLCPKFKVNNSGSYLWSEELTEELTEYEDEVYSFFTFSDFLGTGKLFSIQLGDYDSTNSRCRIATYDYITRGTSSNRYLYEEGTDLINLNYNGKTYNPINTRFNYNATTAFLNDPISDVKAFSLNDVDMNYKNVGQLSFKALVSDPDSETAATTESWLYVYYYYDKVEKELISTENITLEVLNASTSAEYAKSVESELKIYEGNICTITNFLGSGIPMTFGYGEPESGEESDMTVAEIDPTDSYYLHHNGTYYSMNLQDPTDETATIAMTYPYSLTDAGYNAVYKYTDDEIKTEKAKYYGRIYMKGYVNKAWTDWLIVGFNFGAVEATEEPDPVDPVDPDPVEVERTPVGSTTATADFQYYDKSYKDFYAPFEIEVVKNSDGSYTIPNFINSGNDFVFTFEQPEVGKSSNVTLLSKNESVSTAWDWGSTYDDWLLLLGENGEDTWEISAKNPDGVDTYLYEMIFVQDDYSIVTRYDAVSKGYDYYVDLCFYGYDESDGETYYYMSFTFKDPEVEAEEPVEPEPEEPIVTELGTETVTIYPSVDLEDNYTFVDYQSMTSELTRYSDNTCIVSDFLGSGKPVTFKYDEPEAGAYSALTIQDVYEYNTSSGITYYLYLAVDGIKSKYYTLNLTTEAGDPSVYTQAYYFPGVDYTYVYKYPEAEAQEYGYQYCAFLYLVGWQKVEEKNTAFYMNAWFDFGEVESEGGSSVTELDAANEAPVEYYNLNGIRVANPTNGLYIRKQGADVKKVMIK